MKCWGGDAASWSPVQTRNCLCKRGPAPSVCAHSTRQPFKPTLEPVFPRPREPFRVSKSFILCPKSSRWDPAPALCGLSPRRSFQAPCLSSPVLITAQISRHGLPSALSHQGIISFCQIFTVCISFKYTYPRVS